MLRSIFHIVALALCAGAVFPAEFAEAKEAPNGLAIEEDKKVIAVVLKNVGSVRRPIDPVVLYANNSGRDAGFSAFAFDVSYLKRVAGEKC